MADRLGTKNEKFLAEYKERTKGFEIHASAKDDDEGHFSWRPCDTCGSKLGGDRYDMVLCNSGKDHRRREVSSCVDCLVFSANGDLPFEREE